MRESRETLQRIQEIGGVPINIRDLTSLYFETLTVRQLLKLLLLDTAVTCSLKWKRAEAHEMGA